jgi:beta-phosphoglucomutase family hydrolase
LALIFDMDGVMVDSNPYHRLAWEQYNGLHGLATTDEMHCRMYGKRNDQILRDFYGDTLSAEEVRERGAAKERLYRDLIEGRLEEALVPGLRPFLERHTGAPMAVASNAEPPNVDFLLDAAGLRPFFRAVVNGHDVEHPKPHPEVYLEAARRLGVNPSNCIVFEDSHSGVEAATLADMRIVGLRTTHSQLPNTDLDVDNFTSRELERWLLAQTAV